MMCNHIKGPINFKSTYWQETRMFRPWVITAFSVSFQLSGALLLLLYGVTTKRDDIIRSLYSAIAYTEKDGNTNEINDVSIPYREKYRNSYLNKIAFLPLSIGYGLSIFGSVEKDEQSYAFILMVMLTIIVIILIKLLVENFFLHLPGLSKTIKNEDLER